MNMGMQSLFHTVLSIIVDIFPEVELLDHIVIVFFFKFWGELPIFCSIAAAPFYILTKSAQGF